MARHSQESNTSALAQDIFECIALLLCLKLSKGSMKGVGKMRVKIAVVLECHAQFFTKSVQLKISTGLVAQEARADL